MHLLTYHEWYSIWICPASKSVGFARLSAIVLKYRHYTCPIWAVVVMVWHLLQTFSKKDLCLHSILPEAGELRVKIHQALGLVWVNSISYDIRLPTKFVAYYKNLYLYLISIHHSSIQITDKKKYSSNLT